MKLMMEGLERRDLKTGGVAAIDHGPAVAGPAAHVRILSAAPVAIATGQGPSVAVASVARQTSPAGQLSPASPANLPSSRPGQTQPANGPLSDPASTHTDDDDGCGNVDHGPSLPQPNPPTPTPPTTGRQPSASPVVRAATMAAMSSTPAAQANGPSVLTVQPVGAALTQVGREGTTLVDQLVNRSVTTVEQQVESHLAGYGQEYTDGNCLGEYGAIGAVAGGVFGAFGGAWQGAATGAAIGGFVGAGLGLLLCPDAPGTSNQGPSAGDPGASGDTFGNGVDNQGSANGGSYNGGSDNGGGSDNNGNGNNNGGDGSNGDQTCDPDHPDDFPDPDGPGGFVGVTVGTGGLSQGAQAGTIGGQAAHVGQQVAAP